MSRTAGYVFCAIIAILIAIMVAAYGRAPVAAADRACKSRKRFAAKRYPEARPKSMPEL